MKVWVVDDEEGIADLVAEYIEQDYSVKKFTSAKKVIEELSSGQMPDLIMTDMRMPEMDGFDLVKQIRVRNSQLPVVMMSGYADKEQLLKAVEHDIWGFIEKPFDPNKMMKLLKSLIEKSSRILMLEDLVTKYEKLSAIAQDLNTLYVNRYARAENELEEFRPAEVDFQKAKLMIEEFKVQNHLERTLSNLKKEIDLSRNKPALSLGTEEFANFLDQNLSIKKV